MRNPHINVYYPLTEKDGELDFSLDEPIRKFGKKFGFINIGSGSDLQNRDVAFFAKDPTKIPAFKLGLKKVFGKKIKTNSFHCGYEEDECNCSKIE